MQSISFAARDAAIQLKPVVPPPSWLPPLPFASHDVSIILGVPRRALSRSGRLSSRTGLKGRISDFAIALLALELSVSSFLILVLLFSEFLGHRVP